MLPLNMGAMAGGVATASNPLLGILLSTFGSGLIGGLANLGDSPQDEASRFALEQLSKYMGTLKTPAYSKGEIEGKVGEMKDIAGGAANVAAGQIGASLSEALPAAGVPQGQPSASMYVSELAPVIAGGEQAKIGAEQWGVQTWAELDNISKARLLAAIGLSGELAKGQPDMTSFQKLISGFLQGSNIGATGAGNIARLMQALNYKTPDVG